MVDKDHNIEKRGQNGSKLGDSLIIMKHAIRKHQFQFEVKFAVPFHFP